MGLSNAFATALSGLSVTSRRAQVVSSNIANATTPGYARRVLDASSRMVGDTSQGVQVRGILRQTDPVMIADCRGARATAAAKDVAAEFLAQAEAAFG
ncbi:MAG: flagellar hook-associated protein FlgK, partial [Rhodobacteraceae bacterium]|nr:flagellar hook-associated protein FlgK [Paracoccaceae bacterium]